MALESGGAKFKIIYFYFDYHAGESLGNNMLGMFRTLLYKLASNDRGVRIRLERLLEEGRLKLDSQIHLLDAISESFEESSQQPCLFIDGLDEFTGDLDEVVQVCRVMVDRMSIKLCLASRPDTRVTKILNIQPNLIMEEFNERSMRSYVKNKIINKSEKNLEIAKRLSGQIVDSLVAKAQGVLLWFKFVVDEIVERLAQGWDNEQIQSLITQMPRGMNAIYDRMLNMIPLAHLEEAALILYLTFELRNLSQWCERHWPFLGEVCPFLGDELCPTDLNHLWGSYDFIIEQIGAKLNILRLKDHEELRSRTQELLRGLIEFVPSTDTQHCPRSRKWYERFVPKFHENATGIVSVRPVHETFGAYITGRDWIQRHQPSLLAQYFPEPFWLGFCSKVMEQATKDQLIKPQIMERFILE